MKINWNYLVRFGCYSLFPAVLFSCSGLLQLDALPEGTYVVSKVNYAKLTGKPVAGLPAKIRADLEWQDSLLKVMPLKPGLANEAAPVRHIKNLRLIRRTFDLNILTIPFKIRPAVADFPQQMNANFSAAMYMGRRHDIYSLKNMAKNSQAHPRIGVTGVGYGGFVGLGSETMNPFVTQNKINYEYDGFTVNAGVAAIYDPKKFNLGLAIGVDYLLDKNRKAWIYQGQPWFGLLFGINLN
jgi:hypothetical protein